MDRIKYISLILFIISLSVFILSIHQNSPISISEDKSVFFKIPLYFWFILVILPTSLFLISYRSNNILISIICASLYFIIFYSYGLYFLSLPTISDIGSSINFNEILKTTSSIGYQQVLNDQYFQWPIYFVFSKILTSFLGLGVLQTLTIGFFSLLAIIPIIISIFYRHDDNKLKVFYFILPSFYLILTHYSLNSQFVPQFLGLLYLFITFSVYVKYKNEKNSIYLLLILIFYTLSVFTHPFIFIFFIATVIIEKILLIITNKKVETTLSFPMIIILITITSLSYFDFYLTNIFNINNASIGQGGSWNILFSLFSSRNPIATGYQLFPLYKLVPMIYDILFSTITRIIVIASFIIVTIGLIYNFYKKRNIFDFSIILSSIIWYVIGLMRTSFLGSRSLQVATLPLSKQFRNIDNIYPIISTIIIIFICITPSIFAINDVINSSISGEDLIQDYNENYTGKFIEDNIKYDSHIIAAHNAFPANYPKNIRKSSLRNTLDQNFEFSSIELILYSFKLQKEMKYLNIEIFPIDDYSNIYDDNHNNILINFNDSEGGNEI